LNDAVFDDHVDFAEIGPFFVHQTIEQIEPDGAICIA